MSNSTKKTAIAPEFLRELKEDFREADTDKDGHIEFNEFKALLEDLEAGMSDEELRIGFHEIDSDRDGSIDFREFSAWWTEE
jgi:Ca2+-binding EF-hand superfamily protein